MDSKRKRRRDERERKQWAEYHRKRPKVHEFFQSEKRQLTELNDMDWVNIPEPIDLSGQRKRTRERRGKTGNRIEKYTPVPDSVIENARRGLHDGSNGNIAGGGNIIGGNVTSISGLETAGFQTSLPLSSGLMTSLGQSNSNKVNDLTQLGRARDKTLGIQLDKMSDSVSGQTVVDPKGYLTDLTSFHITSEADVSDIRQCRQLLKSLITTNPTHPPGFLFYYFFFFYVFLFANVFFFVLVFYFCLCVCRPNLAQSVVIIVCTFCNFANKKKILKYVHCK